MSVHSAPAYASNDGVIDALSTAIGSDLIEAHEAVGEVSLTVRREAVADVLRMLRDHHAYQQLMEIAGVDYPDRAERFEVVYHLLSLTKNHRVRVRVCTDEATAVPTVTGIWPVAGWLEREVFDMYGVLFAGHPDLRRILTDYGFRGHPFRKDFPLTGHVELRYSEAEERVVYEPVELAQDFRNFEFLSPWEGTDYPLPGDEKATVPPPPPADPKVTEKPADTGAGKAANDKSAKAVSDGAPAIDKGAKAAPPAPDADGKKPARKPRAVKAAAPVVEGLAGSKASPTVAKRTPKEKAIDAAAPKSTRRKGSPEGSA